MTNQNTEFTQQDSLGSNPFSDADSAWIEGFLRSTCTEGMSAADKSAFEDQIEALVPALVELRDGGHIGMNAKTIADFGTLDGFAQLSCDTRLTELRRQRCESIRVRLVVQGVKAFLGHP